ncbi:hypothetical protein ACFQYP_04830 [Nonomuraea antimicrobica]
MSATPDGHVPRDGIHPLVKAAEAALTRSLIDPGHAMRAARAVLAHARRTGQTEAEVVALRSIALAARELGDLEAAEHHLREAIATPAAPPERIAQARLSSSPYAPSAATPCPPCAWPPWPGPTSPRSTAPSSTPSARSPWPTSAATRRRSPRATARYAPSWPRPARSTTAGSWPAGCSTAASSTPTAATGTPPCATSPPA